MVSGWCPCVPIGRRESPAQQQSAASSSRSFGTDGAPFTVSAATDRAEMVQMFYYENRGKCCKKLLRYNGYPNKWFCIETVSQFAEYRILSAFGSELWTPNCCASWSTDASPDVTERKETLPNPVVERWEYKVADGAWFIKSDARGREEEWGGKFELGLVGSTIDRSEIRGSKRNFARLCLRPNEREEKRREEKRRDETRREERSLPVSFNDPITRARLSPLYLIRYSTQAKMVDTGTGTLYIIGSFKRMATDPDFKLYLTSNVSSSDFNMGYSMTGTLERGCKKTNTFQMTHFAVIRRRDYEKAYEDSNPT
ncbi:hypothetical protein WN51_06463 [Melipona quadrifasciata]|uniref:Uncharacterized protein n=1 Tax=Melipona quadrifasciata TaxID=166423 RepID=A0A0M9AC03_9HYME|nr:hypothetical protein WN51_06463 [Melipona quadrifasciata]